MLVAPFFQRIVQLFEQFALVFCQFYRCLNRDVAVQVARKTGANPFDAFAAQSELLARLCAFGQIDSGFTAERGDRDFAAQRSGGETDGYRAMQIVSIALEHLVLFDPNLNVQIARWAAVGSRFAVAGAADSHAVVNTRRNFDFKGFLSLDLALAVAR